MSKLLSEKKHKENYTQPELIKENKKKHNKNIHFTDKLLFDKKLKEFIASYYSNKKSVAVVTDLITQLLPELIIKQEKNTNHPIIYMTKIL